MEGEKIKKALVIDDSETVRNMLRDELSALGHVVKAFEKAEEGLYPLRI